MQFPIYQIDAFTHRLFAGNPAAVCILEDWLEDSVLQNIAAENNLSETSFLVAENDGYRLRWFTPTTEVFLCGHATLAAAWALFEEGKASKEVGVHFYTRDADLFVKEEEGLLSMRFPRVEGQPIHAPAILQDILKDAPLIACEEAIDFMAVLDSEAAVQDFVPDFDQIAKLPGRGFILTAPKADKEHAYVLRFFGPKVGVPEDPVTGSAHCMAAVYWHKAKALSHPLYIEGTQLSTRGGIVQCKVEENAVLLAGEGRLYSKGTVFLES